MTSDGELKLCTHNQHAATASNELPVYYNINDSLNVV